MMRLIDGDVLYEQTAEWENRALNAVMKTKNDEDKTEWQKWSTILAERSAFKFDVADAPTVDAVEVVRCKDCRWCRYLKSATGNYSLLLCGYENAHGMVVNETGYCAWGERREEDNDER